MTKGSGEYLGVCADWYETLDVDKSCLESVFESIRKDASQYGCARFPSRDDLATNETLFREVVKRYEEAKGTEIERSWHPEFRRWILLLFKAGDMPS